MVIKLQRLSYKLYQLCTRRDRPYGYVEGLGYYISSHNTWRLMTDIEPDNILVNYGDSGSRFSDIKLADCGNSIYVDSVVEEHIIGATYLSQPWSDAGSYLGSTHRHLVFGCYSKGPPHDTNRRVPSFNSVKLINLMWGGNWHIFKPSSIDPTDSAYPTEVLRRQDECFGPFPPSYTSLADDDRLDTLRFITESVEKRTPFEMASSQEIAKENRESISKLMQLDPRDRPSAKMLLQDAWLPECTADTKWVPSCLGHLSNTHVNNRDVAACNELDLWSSVALGNWFRPAKAERRARKKLKDSRIRCSPF